MPKFKYNPEHIAKALSKKRLGGICLFNICGAGETLLPKEVIQIALGLLKQGHYVNITTNGTLTERFEEFARFPKNLLNRLQFCFSLHYIELKERSLIRTFFSNAKKVRSMGASICVQFNMCDEYIEHLETIKKLCLENVGALPQIALTRDETTKKEMKIYSRLSREKYKSLGDDFNSPLWDFTNKNFLAKRKEFCYAGDWSFRLNLATGEAGRCYFEKNSQNFFENIDKPISFVPVGKICKSPYCINSSHFMSLGIIPEIKTPTYSSLRNRRCNDGSEWQNKEMKAFLETKLYENNKTIGSSPTGILFYKIKSAKFNIEKTIFKYKNKILQKEKSL